MYQDSIYKKMLTSSDQVKYKGYQYQDTDIMKRFVSNRMFYNPIMAGFLNRISKLFIEMIESIKRVQFYYNYIIDKNDNTLNK